MSDGKATNVATSSRQRSDRGMAGLRRAGA